MTTSSVVSAGLEKDPAAPADLASYDEIIIAFSGGKDSLACVLHLLECGVPPDRLHLHHHLVDGREGSQLMDWPCTPGYCEALAKALGLRLTYSWRMGGFEREMLRNDAATAPTVIPLRDGSVRHIGGNGPKGTRMRFPQVSASLAVRWCSSAAKVDPFARWLCNDPAFVGQRTLVVTGERAQESASRACYAAFEPHRTDLRDGRTQARHVDHWRPIHRWSERDVWSIIERWRLMPHPAYYLGWGRCSCRCCIFGSKNQWATVRVIAPEQFKRIATYEESFGVTIHRKLSVTQLADLGEPYEIQQRWLDLANSHTFDAPVLMLEWELPAGAYGESAGPT